MAALRAKRSLGTHQLTASMAWEKAENTVLVSCSDEIAVHLCPLLCVAKRRGDSYAIGPYCIKIT